MPTALQVLQDHCRRFEDGLAIAATAAEAETLRDRICAQLGESCQSWIVRELLERHAGTLIHARFGSDARVGRV